MSYFNSIQIMFKTGISTSSISWTVISRLPLGLLRGHVCRRPQHGCRLGQLGALYAEAAERAGFINSWYALEDNVFSRPATLTINTSPATISNGLGLTSIDFGACYLEPPNLEEPSELILFRAGLLRVTFLGVVKPTVNL